MPRRELLLVLLSAGALALAGCASHHIVRASPAPSVSAPTVEETPAPPEPPPPPVAEVKPEPVPETEPAPPEPVPAAPAKRPATRPRPAQPSETTEAAAPAQPKPTAPVISPQLSANDLAAKQRNTASDVNEAQRNLQTTNGKSLNAAQRDLVAKVQGFLSQAQEAIKAEDWVQAEILAQKARILSQELVKGL